MSLFTQPLRKTSIDLLQVIAAVLICLAISEIICRMMGYRPWVENPSGVEGFIEADQVLGWRNKPGSFHFEAIVEGGPRVNKTFLPDNSRATRAHQEHQGSFEVLLFGGSMMQGFGLADEQTLGWKLQQRFPDVNVINYGTAAFGGYQSLLMIKRVLKSRTKRQGIVIFGFISDHLNRDVATPAWQRGLSELQSTNNTTMPSCGLDQDEQLECYPPRGYLMLPFRRTLVLARLIEEAHFTLQARSRIKDQGRVTEKVVLKMKELAESKGLSFYMVTFGSPLNKITAEFASLMAKQGVTVVPCVHEKYTEPEMRIPGEGHPNDRMNSLWTECIAEEIANQLPHAIDNSKDKYVKSP